MALTDTQKAQVRMYLGYERSRDLYPELENKFGILSAEEETLIAGILTKLVALDTAIDSVAVGGDLQVIQVDEVKLRDGDPLEVYAAQGRRLVRRLESMFGVFARLDYYGQTAADGGGVIPLG